jgi:hypothetical protein
MAMATVMATVTRLLHTAHDYLYTTTGHDYLYAATLHDYLCAITVHDFGCMATHFVTCDHPKRTSHHETGTWEI